MRFALRALPLTFESEASLRDVSRLTLHVLWLHASRSAPPSFVLHFHLPPLCGQSAMIAGREVRG